MWGCGVGKGYCVRLGKIVIYRWLYRSKMRNQEKKKIKWNYVPFSSVQFSHSVVSSSLRPHGLQHARPPCPSPTPGIYPNSCPLSRWWHPTISIFVLCAFKTWKNLVPQMEKHRPGTWKTVHTHTHTHTHTESKTLIIENIRNIWPSINQGMQVKPKVRHLVFLLD